MIPTFAMERTQELLYHLHQLFQEGRIPRVPVFIDSPLAIKLTEVYKKHESYFNNETSQRHRRASGDDILNFPGLRLTLTTEQSKEINEFRRRRSSWPARACRTAAGSCITSSAIFPIRRARSYSLVTRRRVLWAGRFWKVRRKCRFSAKRPGAVQDDEYSGGYSAHADQPHLLGVALFATAVA